MYIHIFTLLRFFPYRSPQSTGRVSCSTRDFWVKDQTDWFIHRALQMFLGALRLSPPFISPSHGWRDKTLSDVTSYYLTLGGKWTLLSLSDQKAIAGSPILHPSSLGVEASGRRLNAVSLGEMHQGVWEELGSVWKAGRSFFVSPRVNLIWYSGWIGTLSGSCPFHPISSDFTLTGKLRKGACVCISGHAFTVLLVRLQLLLLGLHLLVSWTLVQNWPTLEYLFKLYGGYE